MKISELISKIKVKEYKIINEQEFQCFSRITTELSATRCIFLTDRQYITLIPSRTTMIITTEELAGNLLDTSYGICTCENPKKLYFQLMQIAADSNKKIVPTLIGKNCYISEHAYIAPYNVLIKDNCRIEEFSCIYEGSTISEDCVIHAGAKVGTQDFNFYSNDKKIEHIEHTGKTVLHRGVEIGFNTVIGRALYEYGATVIGEECKIACNSSIGHDVHIGKMSLINSNVSIGGNTTIGDNVNISMEVTIKNGISIGDSVHINMGSVVIRNIEPEETVFGNPARKVLTPK